MARRTVKGTGIIRWWAGLGSLAWFAISALLLFNKKYLVAPWPVTSSILFLVGAVCLFLLALRPRSRRRLDAAAGFCMLSVLYRACGILMSDAPLSLTSSQWIGCIVYVTLACFIGFQAVAFRVVQVVAP